MRGGGRRGGRGGGGGSRREDGRITVQQNIRHPGTLPPEEAAVDGSIADCYKAARDALHAKWLIVN